MTRGSSLQQPASPPPGIGRAGRGASRSGRAFTLLEMLVVVAIIGMLAAVSVPAIRALTQTNTLAAGHRQLLDDLAYARQLAVSGRRVVYLVLAPPTLRAHADTIRRADARFYPPAVKDRALRQLTNLFEGQYTAYALFTRRSVGDQPGRENPVYLTDWKRLPDGLLFETNVFVDLGAQWLNAANRTNAAQRPLPHAWFPFPTADSPEMRLPYVAFNAQGRLYYEGGAEPVLAGEVLPLVRGSVFFPKDSQDRPDWRAAPDIALAQRGDTNRTDVRVDWVTGRARVYRPWEQTAAWR
jgi:prepilin-type N-terminal cleavage/methylation domain-containing protein